MESIVRGEPVDCAQDRLVVPSFVGAYSRITMGVLDWIITTIRWFHLLAAVAWVGGGMFWLMVLRPALGRTGANGGTTRRSIGEEFRSLVNTAIGVLLITGIVLSATRLTGTGALLIYGVIVLGLSDILNAIFENALRS